MPGSTPGMKSSQRPASTRFRIGWRRPSQLLNSPTTLTRRRVRRPDGERGAGHALHGARVGAQALVEPVVGAFGQEVDVHLAQHRREAVGVVEVDLARVPGDAQPVGEALAAAQDRPLEEAGRVGHVEVGHERLAAQDADGRGAGLEGADDERPVAAAVHARGPRTGRRGGRRRWPAPRPGRRGRGRAARAYRQPWAPAPSLFLSPVVAEEVEDAGERDPEPRRPVRDLVGHLVEDLLDGEEPDQPVGLGRIRGPARRVADGPAVAFREGGLRQRAPAQPSAAGRSWSRAGAGAFMVRTGARGVVVS